MPKETGNTHHKSSEKKKENTPSPSAESRKPKAFGDNLLKIFSLKKDQEKLKEIMDDVRDGIPFHGTNLWILILAIFIASIGLNINSTAVIIGAMLISPLMGPIIGMGVSLAIHDIPLLKKAINNYLLAVGISLATSLLYFSISPISIAHSEIIARTSPTIYDVLIALFGGIAGSIALASTKKGNVVPGVAIATALMPPLCTAGYAIATLNFTYFAGAFYLFVINTVFITTSAFIVARLLRFPYKKFLDERTKSQSKQAVLVIVILTVLPSIYFGYDIVQQTQFSEKANQFIQYESNIEGDYLLSRSVDAKTKTIQLIYGGNPITQEQIDALKSKLSAYNIANATLKVKQGFASFYEEQQQENSINTQQNAEQIQELTTALEASQSELSKLKEGTQANQILSQRVFEESQLLYPSIVGLSFSNQQIATKSGTLDRVIASIIIENELTENQKNTITNWLKIRTENTEMVALFEEKKEETDEDTVENEDMIEAHSGASETGSGSIES